MKTKKIRQMLADLRHSVKNGVPHDLTFRPTGNMTKQQVKDLQEALNYHYGIWANTWLYPVIDQIDALVQQSRRKHVQQQT